MSEGSHAKALVALLSFEQPLHDLLRQLRSFPDADAELVTLQASHLQSILNRFLAGELTSLDLENWADVVEACDDIGFDPEHDELLKQTIFELANPAICGEIAPPLVRRLLSEFTGSSG